MNNYVEKTQSLYLQAVVLKMCAENTAKDILPRYAVSEECS